MSRPNLENYFMVIAHAVARRATCTRHHVGCVIVDQTNRIISTGYNGAPTGLKHCLDVGCIRDKKNIPSGERQEYCRGAHAEQNALIQAEDRDKLNGATLYCTHTPCLMCLKMILNAKIHTVFHGGNYPVTDLADALIHESGLVFIDSSALITKKEIEEALEQGRKESAAFLAAQSTLPGHYK